MLSDWEKRQWADVEHELSSNWSSAARFGLPSQTEHRWLAFCRWFYPTGYLLSAVTYMVLALGGSQLLVLFGAVLLGMAWWLLMEWRAAKAESVKAMWRRLDSR